MRSTKRATATVSALLLAMAGAGLAIAPTASAVPPILCTGQQSVTYSPGLKQLTPQTVTYTATGSYGSCPVNDGVTSVVYSEGGTVPNATCIAFPSTANATLTWTKAGGGTEHSTVKVTGVEVDVAGLTQAYVSTGEVQSGRYAGHLVQVTVIALPDLSNPLPCLTPAGLTHLNALSTVEIL